MRAVLRPTVLAFSTALISAAVLAGGQLAPAGAASTSHREARLLAKISHARVAHDLSPLRAKPHLMAYARSHAAAMAANRKLFHTTNFGVLCCWTRIGENIAYNATVRRVHRAFMASPGHRANILDPRFRRVGVGIVNSGGLLWVTEVFTKPA